MQALLETLTGAAAVRFRVQKADTVRREERPQSRPQALLPGGGVEDRRGERQGMACVAISRVQRIVCILFCSGLIDHVAWHSAFDSICWPALLGALGVVNAGGDGFCILIFQR